MGHRGEGTAYGQGGHAAYERARHGTDGEFLLDPFFLPDLEQLEGKLVLDAGCGAGPWTVYCAVQGAMVYGIDLQEGMIARAEEAVHAAVPAEALTRSV